MVEKTPLPTHALWSLILSSTSPKLFFVDVYRQYVAISYDSEPSSENSLSDSTLPATDEQRDETAGLQREGYGDGNEETMDEEEQR